MLGVQAAGCDTIARAFETGKLDRSGVGDTYADSINVPIPRNWRKAVNCVRESNGAYVAATDEEIQAAVRLTGRLTGVFAEPAAATAVAGIAVARKRGVLDQNAMTWWGRHQRQRLKGHGRSAQSSWQPARHRAFD